jgi:hypothetical protein
MKFLINFGTLVDIIFPFILALFTALALYNNRFTHKRLPSNEAMLMNM